jgi:hypothetical protein
MNFERLNKVIRKGNTRAIKTAIGLGIRLK